MPRQIETTAAPGMASSPRAEQIRASAGELFSSKGYAATTMQDIADAVGILPGSLYHHFTAKETIAVELCEALYAALLDVAVRSRRPENAARPPEERLLRLVADVSLVGRRHAPAVGLRVFQAPAVATERLHATINHRPLALQRVWRSVISDLAEQAPSTAMDQEMLAIALQGLSIHPGAAAGAGLDVEQSSRLLCDMLLHGIVADCPPDRVLDASAPMAAVRDAIEDYVAPDPGDETRAGIAAAARQQFALRGFDATTIRDIADAAGVRMGTLYRRIESKDAIFAEIVDNYDRQLDTVLRAALTTPAESEAETLDALAFGIVHEARRFPDETRMMSLIWNRQQEVQAQVRRYTTHTNERLALLTGVLENGQAAGRIRPVASAEVLAGYVRSVLWIGSGRPGRASGRRIRRFLREHLLRGALTER